MFGFLNVFSTKIPTHDMTHDMKFALKKCSGEKKAFLTQNSKLNIGIFSPSHFLQRQGIHCPMPTLLSGRVIRASLKRNCWRRVVPEACSSLPKKLTTPMTNTPLRERCGLEDNHSETSRSIALRYMRYISIWAWTWCWNLSWRQVP